MVEALGFPYFWLCVLFFGGSAIARVVISFVRPGVVSRWDVFVAALSFPALIAHYGLLMATPFLVPLFWQILAVAVVGENVRFFFTAKARDLVTQVGPTKAAAVLVPLTVFSIPFLWAVVQYAFFSPAIFS